jgi:hypothetical protein
MIRMLIAAMLFAAALSGCTKSDSVPVTGTLLLDGQPVDQAEVQFNPKTGRMASGVTDASGHFKLSTAKPNDGAVPGEYTVTLFEYYPADKPPKMTGGPLPSRFSTKYANPATSPLNAKVERGAKNDFKFEATK